MGSAQYAPQYLILLLLVCSCAAAVGKETEVSLHRQHIAIPIPDQVFTFNPVDPSNSLPKLSRYLSTDEAKFLRVHRLPMHRHKHVHT
jgi:hypothetical protein